MAILNYTTKIDSQKTILEIQQILVKHGATKIVSDYEGDLISSLTFCIDMNGNTVAFKLPCNYDGVLQIMKKDKKVPNSLCTKEQSLRVSWRILKTWIEAQMALVEINMVDLAEVFLPYAITKNGTTVYQEIISGNGMLLLK